MTDQSEIRAPINWAYVRFVDDKSFAYKQIEYIRAEKNDKNSYLTPKDENDYHRDKYYYCKWDCPDSCDGDHNHHSYYKAQIAALGYSIQNIQEKIGKKRIIFKKRIETTSSSPTRSDSEYEKVTSYVNTYKALAKKTKELNQLRLVQSKKNLQSYRNNYKKSYLTFSEEESDCSSKPDNFKKAEDSSNIPLKKRKLTEKILEVGNKQKSRTEEENFELPIFTNSYDPKPIEPVTNSVTTLDVEICHRASNSKVVKESGPSTLIEDIEQDLQDCVELLSNEIDGQNNMRNDNKVAVSKF